MNDSKNAASRPGRGPSRLALALMMAWTPLAAWAESGGDSLFQLGAVRVTAARPVLGEIASEQVSSVVSAEDIRRFDRTTVGDAVNLLSGVTVSTNSRNEQMVYPTAHGLA